MVSADGETQLTITDAFTAEVFAVQTGVNLGGAGRFSIALGTGKTVIVTGGDATGLAADEARLQVLFPWGGSVLLCATSAGIGTRVERPAGRCGRPAPTPPERPWRW
ncbi:MAG: hypothetical protein JXX28_01530 [Deltaproteobacteria bacterium]|nr:hypothetical protein [Deltaproteobacteria bacterium]